MAVQAEQGIRIWLRLRLLCCKLVPQAEAIKGTKVHQLGTALKAVDCNPLHNRCDGLQGSW
jgi:hypothetical protein